MKRVYFLAMLLTVTALTSVAQKQKAYTFKIETLAKPEKILPVSDYNGILNFLIESDRIMTYDGRPKIDTTHNIVAKSKMTDSLVSYGYHSFYQGMYNAYAQHRPFTLSPDMIWLLIAQGFSSHVNNNSAELRSLFTGVDGVTALVVQTDKIKLSDPKAPWEEMFPEFSRQIAQHTGKAFTDAMTADFSTTTQITKIASQITLMDAMKSYYEYILFYMACGIPDVTLEGTPQDWQHVLEKTEALRKYKLDWWVDELEPVLKQFVQASKKKVDVDFWMGMFKLHQGKGCGSPDKIDGWIVKFFPYDKQGKRNSLKELVGKNNLPNEIVKVDLTYVEQDATGKQTVTPLELWAGFIGLKQDKNTFGLNPQIGWMIKKKDNLVASEFMSSLKTEATRGRISLRVKNIPPELFKIDKVERLKLEFLNDIVIPQELTKITMKFLDLKGHTTEDEADRIVAMFPNTKVTINKNDFYFR